MQKTKQTKLEAYTIVWERARLAADRAGSVAVPRPMVVVQHKHVLDDSSPVERVYHVPEGICGFAWVHLRPGTHSFVRWLKKQNICRPAYGGGMQIWIDRFGQSYERKMVAAQAMAKVLSEVEGLSAYASGRLD